MGAEKQRDAESLSTPSSQNGDSQDVLDMAKLGKKQQLLRHFDFWAILGFACVTMITWEGLLSTFVYGLANGGPAGLVYGFIFVWLGFGVVNASLAELMSMWPTSGGQYHWSYTLSPPKWAPFVSYICGWQSVVAWQALTASACYLISTTIQGIAILDNSSYSAQRWQGTLIMYAMILLILVFSIFGNRFLPQVDYIALAIHILGFVIVIAVIATLSPAETSTHDVFDVWLNNGYSSQGVSFLVGLQGIVFAWLGADGAIHMSEEIKNASRIVPWCLMSSVAVNGILGFGMLLAVLYFGPSGDALTAALESPTGYPFLAIFAYAANSIPGGVGISCIIAIMGCLAVLMIFTATTRELWAFARDNGVPGSSVLARIDKKSKIPLWSMALTATITILLALINIGSSVAFNAILSLTVAGYIGSYAFPITLVLYRRIQALRGVGPELPWGPWKLGIWGIPINILSLCWIVIIFVFSFFPIEPLPNLTVQTMNWSSLAYGAITIFAVVFWFVHGKRTFKGPVRDASGGQIEAVLGWEMRREEARNKE